MTTTPLPKLLVTCVGIVLLLDDQISRFFPDAPESWKKITVRHLLTHTSGMGAILTA